MINLLKVVEMPWEKARGYLRLDLQTIESTLNQRWAATFGSNNTLNLNVLGAGVIPISNGGTGASVFTLGSVIFMGATAFAQDNPNFFWDTVNKQLALGNNTPAVGNVIDAIKTYAGPLGIRVKNLSTAGGNVHASLFVENSTSYGQLFKAGTNYTPYKNIGAGDLGFFNITSGNISVLNDAGNINFAGNGATTPQLTLATAGALAPKLIGGTGTTSTLTFQTTTAIAATGSDCIWLGGNNGGTELLRLRSTGLLTFGGLVAQPALKASGSQLQVRYANDSDYTMFSAGPTSINGTAADSAALRITGSMNFTSPVGLYMDAAFTNIYTTGIAAGFFIQPSFSLTGNALRVVSAYYPVSAVTLNGFTVTEAVTLLVDGAPTNGTNKYALFVRAGLSEFDGLVGLGSTVSKYNNVNTTGWGVPAIYGFARPAAGQTGAVASVATYTVGAADGSFLVSANVNVTVSTLHNFTVTCNYTDETNTPRVLTMSFSQLTGAIVTAITNATGAGAYEGIILRIRCKASTAITFSTVGVFTTVTYNVEADCTQVG